MATVTMLDVRTATAALEAAGLSPINRLPAWADVVDTRRLSALPMGGYMPSRGPATAAVICGRAQDVVRDFVPWMDNRHELDSLVERIIWALAGPDMLHREVNRVRRDDVPGLVDRLILEPERIIRRVFHDAVEGAR